MKIESKKYRINQTFGNLFLIVGIFLVYDSCTAFFEYNFPQRLFKLSRNNSSIIAEFIFGVLLSGSGILMLTESKIWLNIMKPLAIGIIVNIAFALILIIIQSEFDSHLIIGILVGISFSYGIYKLAKYLIDINDSEWNIKAEKINLIIGILIGVFPYLFLNVYF